MPALVNNSVSSPIGTTGEEGTNVCSYFLTKKSINCWRISLPVRIGTSKKRTTENTEGTERSNTDRIHETKRGGYFSPGGSGAPLVPHVVSSSIISVPLWAL